jgi:putative tributyrin esterase
MSRSLRKLFTTIVIATACCLFTARDSAGTYPAARAQIQTIQFRSELLNATLPYNVILPRGYSNSPLTRFPVLYLLHGLSGHYSDWATRTHVAEYASHYQMIVVMPEGKDGWYTDSATRPDERYETYLLKELIPDVQKRFRTLDSRFGRSIAGLSMGGYGAIKFGLKSPATFIFAASISGAFGAPSWTESDLKTPGAMRDSVLGVFGPAGSDTRKANDIFELVRNLSATRMANLPYFYLDCGTEDPFFNLNPEFAALLREKKVPHEYRELPGQHGWDYWDQQVEGVLKVAAEKMRMPKRQRAKGGS